MQRAAAGNQTLLYFLLPSLTVSLGGLTEWSLRLPSLCAGVVLVPAVACLVRRWSGSTVCALVAACWVATDRTCVFYAQEARVYACLQLATIGQIGCFRQLLQPAAQTVAMTTGFDRQAIGWWRILFVGSSILLFYLHYTAIVLLLAELLWFWLQHLRAQRGYRLSDMIRDMLLIVLCIMPSIWHLFQIGHQRQMWERLIPQQPFWVVVEWFHWDSYVMLPWLLGLVILALENRWSRTGWSSFHDRLRQVCQREAGDLGLVLSWMVTPALITWLATEGNVARLFWPRYLLATAVAPMVLGSLSLTVVRHRWIRVMLGFVIIAYSIGSEPDYQVLFRSGQLPASRNQDWRGAAKILTQAAVESELRPTEPSKTHQRSVREARVQTTARAIQGSPAQAASKEFAAATPAGRNAERRVRTADEDDSTDRENRPSSPSSVMASDDRPVFVRSGLLEADQWFDQPSSLQFELCRSPLLTIYTIPRAATRLFPLKSIDAGLLTREAVERVESAGGAWFVINGTPQLQANFTRDLSVSFPKTAWQLRHFHLAGTVQVWELTQARRF